MIRHWDEFYGGPNVHSDDKLHISLSNKGNILLNNRAFETLGSPEAAVLLYDRRNSTIGVRPAPAGTAHAFPLCRKSNVKHRLIRAMPFCRHHQLIVKRTVAFPEAEIDDDGTMLLDLHTAMEIGRVEK
jgi:hypothetical protein